MKVSIEFTKVNLTENHYVCMIALSNIINEYSIIYKLMQAQLKDKICSYFIFDNDDDDVGDMISQMMTVSVI